MTLIFLKIIQIPSFPLLSQDARMLGFQNHFCPLFLDFLSRLIKGRVSDLFFAGFRWTLTCFVKRISCEPSFLVFAFLPFSISFGRSLIFPPPVFGKDFWNKLSLFLRSSVPGPANKVVRFDVAVTVEVVLNIAVVVDVFVVFIVVVFVDVGFVCLIDWFLP